MQRRAFLKTCGTMAGGLASSYALAQEAVASTATKHTPKFTDPSGALPRRVLGKTGEHLSIVGFPGNALRHCTEEQGVQAMQRAVERGINLFDVAPTYGKDGEAEIKMGRGLQAINRDAIFLACKTQKRDKAGAREELERSLTRLGTDHLDLYQLHILRKPEEVEQAMGPNGAMETLLAAQKEGKIRYLGFSAHTTLSALAAMEAFRFDTVMFPVNFVEHFTFAFGQAVLEVAHQQNMGVLAIKTFANGKWSQDVPQDKRNWWYPYLGQQPEAVGMALRFSLSQKGVASTLPASFVDLLDEVVDAAQTDRPITPAELEKLKEMAKPTSPLFLDLQRKAIALHQGECHGEEETFA